MTKEVALWDSRKQAMVKALTKLEMDPLEFERYRVFCEVNNLDPFVGDVSPVRYGGKDPKIVYIVSIAGHLKMAARSGKFRGFAPPTLVVRDKKTSELVEIPLILFDESRHELVRAVARVLHSEMPVPQEYTADLSFYKRDNDFWKGSLASNMLYKCAQAVAIRRTFAEDASGVYSPEEMQQAGAINVTATVVEPPKAPRKKLPPTQTAEEKWEVILGYLKTQGCNELGVKYAESLALAKFAVDEIAAIDDADLLGTWARKDLLKELKAENFIPMKREENEYTPSE